MQSVQQPGSGQSDRDAARTARYDAAAPRWHDKMRALGYYDAYLGFLSAPGMAPCANARVMDVGAGTGAFAEAWVAVHGQPSCMTLVDPSQPMLQRAAASLARRGVDADVRVATLEDVEVQAPYDEILAAHLIEHFEDPAPVLLRLRACLRPGGLLRLVVSKPHWCNAIIWFQWRHRSYRREHIQSVLETGGWDYLEDYSFPAGPPSRTSRGYLARRI